MACRSGGVRAWALFCKTRCARRVPSGHRPAPHRTPPLVHVPRRAGARGQGERTPPRTGVGDFVPFPVLPSSRPFPSFARRRLLILHRHRSIPASPHVKTTGLHESGVVPVQDPPLNAYRIRRRSLRGPITEGVKDPPQNTSRIRR